MVEQKEIAYVIDVMVEHAQYKLIQQPPPQGTSGHSFCYLHPSAFPANTWEPCCRERNQSRALPTSSWGGEQRGQLLLSNIAFSKSHPYPYSQASSYLAQVRGW